jgi:ABC-type branched-subunit amino acid transport system ATPase component
MTMNDRANILSLQDVSFAADSTSGLSLCNLNSSLAAGDLVVVFLEKEQARTLLADAAEGLVAPTQGVVTFLGEDWQTMTPDRVAQQRGRIGRLFEGECWLSDLYVDQDITLAQQHHTRRARKEIEAEAIQLGQVFGLPGLPGGRSPSVPRQDLQKAACVRAFLGAPVLLLLENPAPGLYADLIAPLLKTVHAARQRGAALLWTTDQLEVWNNPELRPTTRCRMNGSHLQVTNEGGKAA